jgi:outer membrane protein assembly factor BamB
VTDDRVYAASTESAIRAFDVADGAAIGRGDIDGKGQFTPAIADESLYVVSEKGTLYAFE